MFSLFNDDEGTVVGLLAERVRQDISFGELAPDTKLKIEELRRAYGGSAHSIREALMILAAEGLVEATAQKGFRVTSATQADLEDITRLRAEIESLGLHWSMEKGDVEWEGNVIASHHALTRAEAAVEADPIEQALDWDDANRAFHSALIASCESRGLLEIQNRLFIQGRRFRLAALREGQIDFAGNKRALADIMEHSISRNAKEAVKALRTHIMRQCT